MLRSLCVKAVESRWFGGVKLVCLTHSQPVMNPSWGKSRPLSPMFSCSLEQAAPQQLTAFNSYVFHFSTLPTGLIKITTKYIN